jgi:hypothetical protein
VRAQPQPAANRDAYTIGQTNRAAGGILGHSVQARYRHPPGQLEPQAVKNLQVSLSIEQPFTSASLASGRKVEKSGKSSWTMDLDVADALILR